MLYAWKASDCSMVRVQISFTLGVATNGLILILTIVEPHWIFLKGILRIESELQLCPSPAIKVIELEVNYFTFQWLRDHLQPYLQETRHEMCSLLFVKVWSQLIPRVSTSLQSEPTVVLGTWWGWEFHDFLVSFLISWLIQRTIIFTLSSCEFGIFDIWVIWVRLIGSPL
jgi:hypothetical protein